MSYVVANAKFIHVWSYRRPSKKMRRKLGRLIRRGVILHQSYLLAR